MALRIHADPAWFSKDTELCPLLVPWGDEFGSDMRFRFCDDPYVQTGLNYFLRATPSECDFVICPSKWQNEGHSELVRRLASQARIWRKPLIVFCETDTEAPFPIPGVIVFRGSLRRSSKLPTEIPAPAFIPDRLAGPWPAANTEPRVKAELPAVGFCGCVDTEVNSLAIKRALVRAVYWGLLSRPRAERILRSCGLRITRSEGKRVRYQALGVVSRCHGLRKNLLMRQHFMNGYLTVPEETRKDHWRRSFAEFRDNILASDYTLCPRGGGNWSYRFYETLCLGRIPVFFNTDCVLPYESSIHWRDYCVWVEGDEMERTAQDILHHYQSHTAEEFIALQRRCRQLWRDYLSLDGFFRNLHLNPELQRHRP
jgi:Exostosin family